MFFGVMPDPGTAKRVDALRRRLAGEGGLQGSAVGRDRLHVSLHLVGDFKRLRTSDVYKAQLAASLVAMAPFDVIFDRVETFAGLPAAEGAMVRWPTVLRGSSAGLTALHQALGAAMRQWGLRAGTAFKAHITLCYGPSVLPRQSIDPIRFTVSDFRLIHSELGLSRYNFLGRWPLCPASSG
jgi:2'-5' RNA ligase